MSARIVVLVSGSGSNLQAIVDACDEGRLDASVVGVISNKKQAYGLIRAEQAGVPARWLSSRPFRDELNAQQGRERYDKHLAEQVETWSPDLVVLAGFMRILSAGFIRQFKGRLINLHPALPGQFPGIRAIERALRAANTEGIQETGVMIHHVIEEVDAGPVVACERVPITAEDDLESLSARIHAVEHRLLVDAIDTLLTDARTKQTSNTIREV
ncbi:MAG TPA: phosphoribosylglycinamide formyltransferase [Myxococcales bacterium]|nr:phosphoribosylglycinamide formyltransferase [Myxococcales bacterium]